MMPLSLIGVPRSSLTFVWAEKEGKGNPNIIPDRVGAMGGYCTGGQVACCATGRCEEEL